MQSAMLIVFTYVQLSCHQIGISYLVVFEQFIRFLANFLLGQGFHPGPCLGESGLDHPGCSSRRIVNGES